MIKRLLKKLLEFMIEVGNTIITAITVGSTTPGHIDVGSTQVWPDSGPSPEHTYVFGVSASTTNVGYPGGTIVFNITSKRDGERYPLTCTVQERGLTPDWVIFLQSAVSQTYDYVFYYGISQNTGVSRNAGFTFTQDGSGDQKYINISQEAYTTAFDGLTIKATRNSEYGNWVIGTIDNGNGGPAPTYPNRAVVIACDQPITGTRRISYTLTASRLKSLPAPQSGTSTVTLNLTQSISAGATVQPVTSGSGKTYYGAFVILTDTSFQNGEWVNTPGSHTTMSPYPSQDASGVTITNIFTG